MPLPLARVIEERFRGLLIGPPIFDESGNLANMVVYPVFPTELGEDPPGIITLTEGLRKGVRLTDTGMVSQVHVDNPLPASVLVGESEVLMGPTQRRAVQYSCLVPPFRRASLPVNCVEAGQPTVYQAAFTNSGPCPWYLRSFKMEQLAHHGESHQHQIWERIRDYLKATGTVSGTQDVGAVFGTFAGDVASLARAFPLQAGQTGAICAVGQDLFLELYGDPELLEDRYAQVLRSALVEAVAHPSREVPPGDQVRQLPGSLVEASRHSRTVDSRSLRDGGRTQVFCANGIAGSALVSGGRLVHLTAHKRCWGFGRPFDEQLQQLERERETWRSEHGAMAARLEVEYGRRQRQYERFKSDLSPHAPLRSAPGTSDDRGGDPRRDEPAAVRPLPLNQVTFDFFLRLFRRD
ncbi:MAG: DUF6569 family protein [Gemmatimonadota bacterium]